AAAARPAVAEPLADDVVARHDPADGLADLLDDTAPLVTRNARIPDPAQVELALEHLDVGAAQPGEPAPHGTVARPADGGLDLSVDDLVRALYDDRLHGA